MSRRAALGSLAGLIAQCTAADNPDDNVPLKIGGGEIQVSFDSASFDVPRAALLDWVRVAARAVTAYYGRYPVPRARVHIHATGGRGVRNGVSYGDDGVWCRISVGRHTTASDLHDDWTLTHEMVHFGFPSLPRRHHWMEEGMATYVEPIARAQVGNLTAEQVWGGMLRDMHQGLPAPGDQGLDNTHTWGRTYWGGALFCLLADIGIRRHTHNTLGLEDALRAINRAGGTIDVDWSLRRTLDTGDRATHGHVLTNLHRKMGARPVAVDLPALWKRLGVRWQDSRIVFDASAPEAAAREAIMRGSARTLPESRRFGPHGQDSDPKSTLGARER